MGLVFVLLLGEIDLSAGVTAGTAAAVMGVFLTNHHWNWILATIVCLLTGAVIGLVIGLLGRAARHPLASSSRWPRSSACRA